MLMVYKNEFISITERGVCGNIFKFIGKSYEAKYIRMKQKMQTKIKQNKILSLKNNVISSCSNIEFQMEGLEN